MKSKIVLPILFLLPVASMAQQKNNAYAITSVNKGGSSWTEVRLIDLSTGEGKSVYESKSAASKLNARSGKAIASTTAAPSAVQEQTFVVRQAPEKNDASGNAVPVKRTVYVRRQSIDETQPFATNSAALAYDKKHDRLYYTPMGIAQLRYIDLKASTPQVFYFENEAFGSLKSRHDGANQITRMVIASDGNGYALSNNAEHLIRFSTNKKGEIKDLGALTDDVSNGKNSVHAVSVYGGDMIAGNKGTLYLVGANRKVFAIDTDKMSAKFLGDITGLPKGYSTNGAVVLDDEHIAVSSSQSVQGYYKVQFASLKGEKLSGEASVYNASDLANNLFLNEKKVKKAKEINEVKPVVAETPVPLPLEKKDMLVASTEEDPARHFSIYPNPVQGRKVKLLFRDEAAGDFRVQVLDLGGKLLSTQQINLTGKNAMQEIALPPLATSGTYLLKVLNRKGQVIGTEKLVVE